MFPTVTDKIMCEQDWQLNVEMGFEKKLLRGYLLLNSMQQLLAVSNFGTP